MPLSGPPIGLNPKAVRCDTAVTASTPRASEIEVLVLAPPHKLAGIIVLTTCDAVRASVSAVSLRLRASSTLRLVQKDIVVVLTSFLASSVSLQLARCSRRG